MKMRFGYLLLFFFMHALPVIAGSQFTPIVDYGDPKAALLWNSFKELETGGQKPLRILQLGDSHTAGDYFTGRLRQQLQQQFGNAGMGWLTPGYILNQRSHQVLLRSKGTWKLSDSKQQKHTGIFPVGGLINQSSGNSILEIKAKEPPQSGKWRLSIWHQSQQIPWSLSLHGGKLTKLQNSGDKKSAWRLSSQDVDASQVDGLKLLAPNHANLGGVILDRWAPGVTLDALGINGATSAVIARWDQSTLQTQLQWRNPQLIILAYGTNEAFDTDIVPDMYEQELRQVIHRLRTAAPEAAILLLGAPVSAKTRAPNVNGGCRTPLPPSLLNVQNTQRRVAKQERTLYWDWAAMMGGNCAAQAWLKQNPPLMRPDLVHLTPEGYTASADALFLAMMNAIHAKKH